MEGGRFSQSRLALLPGVRLDTHAVPKSAFTSATPLFESGVACGADVFVLHAALKSSAALVATLLFRVALLAAVGFLASLFVAGGGWLEGRRKG